MEQLFGWLLALLFVLFPQPAVEPTAAESESVSEIAEVVNVIDGDTIDVLLTSGGEARVRYIGIDTPEPYAKGEPECYANEATVANERLLEGSVVSLRADREDMDRFGRLLRYVYVGDKFVNAELVRGGYATVIRIEPNTEQYVTLKSLENQAAGENIGLWGDCLDK